MLRGTAWLPGAGFVWRTGARWAELYLRFSFLACTTFTYCLEEGVGERVGAGWLSGLWVPAARRLSGRTAASLARAQLGLAALQAPDELSSAGR